MSVLRETLFDLMLNGFLQIGLFAVVTAAFSRVVSKARAKHQYSFYVTVLLVSLMIPVINTLWRPPSSVVPKKSQQQIAAPAGGANPGFWSWESSPTQHKQFTIAPEIQS